MTKWCVVDVVVDVMMDKFLAVMQRADERRIEVERWIGRFFEAIASGRYLSKGRCIEWIATS